jgi:hypothetical protein
MLRKLRANPGDDQQGAKDQDENKSENRGKYYIQSVSPLELAETFHPCHDREAGVSWAGLARI